MSRYTDRDDAERLALHTAREREALILTMLRSTVAHVLDTALSPDHAKADIVPGTVLVGWQCGFEVLTVAVVPSYTEPDEDEAVDIAVDYLLEKQWFADSTRTEPDYVLTIPKEGRT